MKKIAVIFMALTLMIPFSTSFINVNAEDSDIIRNDESGIPDKNFYVQALDQYDYNNDGILTKGEVAGADIVSISVYDEDIDLKGISNFRGAFVLRLENNGDELKNIKNLEEIKSNLNLTEISIRGFKDFDENIFSNYKLNIISLHDTDLNDLNFIKKLSDIHTLDVSKIEDLSKVNDMINLDDLNLFEPGNISEIDFSRLKNLTDLRVYGLLNTNKDLINQAKSVQNLEITGSENIKEMDIGNLDNLTDLVINGVGLTQITGLNNLINLENVDLSFNDLNSIEKLSNLSHLKVLDIYGNHFKNLDFLSECTNLRELNATDNSLIDISGLQGLTSLKKLDLSFNQLTDINVISNLINLESLDVNNNSIASLPNLKNLTKLNFEKTENGSYLVSFYDNKLSKEDLINSLPDKVVNYPDWIEENVSKPKPYELELDSIYTDESFNQVKDLINDQYTKGVIITTENFDYIPSRYVDLIKESRKILTFWDYARDNVWTINTENVDTIDGDVVTTFTEGSPYEDEIKKATGIDTLYFMTYNGNLTINKYSEDNRLTDDIYPVGKTITTNIFINDKYVEPDSAVNLNPYGYNPSTGEIINLGDSYPAEKEGPFYLCMELKEGFNTIFVSTKKGLETIKIEQPQEPNKITMEISGNKIEEEKIITALKDDNVEDVVMNITQSDTISKELIEEIRKSNKTVTFNIVDENGKTIYSWTINGESIKDKFDKDLNTNIDFRSDKADEIKNITGQDNMFYLQFAYHGKLPAPTKIKVDVSDKYKDGDYIYLYYYNEEKETIELATDKIKVVNGYAEFTLDHCSTYFLTNKEIKDDIDVSIDTDNQSNNSVNEKTTDQVKTSDNSQIGIYAFGCIISIFVIAGCIAVKKRKS